VESTAQIEFRQVRDFSEILNATFNFFRQNFRNLLKQILLIMGPLIIFISIYTVYFFSTPTPQDLTSFDFSRFFISFIPLYLIVGLTFLIYSTALYAYIILYMDKGFDQFETTDILKTAAKNLPKTLGFSIISSIFILVATTIFILPGIYIAVPLTFGLIIIFREGTGIFETISRCFQIISDHWWQTFGILFITFFIIYLFSFALSLPQAAVEYVIAFNSPEKADLSNWKVLSLILSIITSLFAYVFYSLGYIAISFQYFSLVEQKEVHGLLKRIESIEKSENEQ